MNITSSGIPANSSFVRTRPAVSGSEKGGAGVPSGSIVEGVRAMPARYGRWGGSGDLTPRMLYAPRMAFDRITSHPQIQQGQPCIRGMRLTVRRVLDLVATYPDRRELHEEFPEIEDEDIRQALTYAATRLEDEVVELRPGS